MNFLQIEAKITPQENINRFSLKLFQNWLYTTTTNTNTGPNRIDISIMRENSNF